MNVLAADRYFRYIMAGLAAVLWLAQLVLPHHVVLEAAFVVIMAGNVGYFTNYLAIRMLFQPKQGRVLGWQGLVPRNKDKIARSLAQSIQNQLLAPEIILAYIEEKNLVETGINRLANWIDSYLQDVDRRQELTGKIISYLRENGGFLLEKGFEIVEQSLQKWAASPEKVEKSWEFLRSHLVRYLSIEKNRLDVANFIRNLLLRQIPAMARSINNALEEFLRRRKMIGKIGLGLKNLFSIDEESLENVLERFIEDPETTAELLGTLDILVEEFGKAMKESPRQKIIMRRLKRWVAQVSSFSRLTLLEGSILWLQDYLRDENNWNKVEDLLIKFLQAVKKKIEEFMTTEEGRAFLKDKISMVVRKIRVSELIEKQVMKLDTDELEQMILSNTGGNLVVIQLLGGVLGLIAGLIQVHYYFAFPVLFFTVLVLFSAWQNRRRYRLQSHG
ncbi:MAG: DUF445 domain-containing protein [Leptospiraceae bacterium]|nr:DUF445 domain-containing protein [Leptospiraceae bacterium]MDW8305618.1 DUF445 family protein [Leptospiraceae bacterium]